MDDSDGGGGGGGGGGRDEDPHQQGEKWNVNEDGDVTLPTNGTSTPNQNEKEMGKRKSELFSRQIQLTKKMGLMEEPIKSNNQPLPTNHHLGTQSQADLVLSQCEKDSKHGNRKFEIGGKVETVAAKELRAAVMEEDSSKSESDQCESSAQLHEDGATGGGNGEVQENHIEQNEFSAQVHAVGAKGYGNQEVQENHIEKHECSAQARESGAESHETCAGSTESNARSHENGAQLHGGVVSRENSAKPHDCGALLHEAGAASHEDSAQSHENGATLDSDAIKLGNVFGVEIQGITAKVSVEKIGFKLGRTHAESCVAKAEENGVICTLEKNESGSEVVDLGETTVKNEINNIKIGAKADAGATCVLEVENGAESQNLNTAVKEKDAKEAVVENPKPGETFQNGVADERVRSPTPPPYEPLSPPGKDSCTGAIRTNAQPRNLLNDLNRMVTCAEKQLCSSAPPSASSSAGALVSMARRGSALKRRGGETENGDASAPKKKRSITFDGVTVFYFPRAQGFTCVPSQGGSTLGMASTHSFCRRFTLQEHGQEQRRVHKQMLLRLRQEQQHQQQEALRSTTQGPTGGGSTNVNGTTNGGDPEDDLTPLMLIRPDQGSDSEESPEEEESDSDVDLDNYYFLQPVPTKQRRMLLREAGVRKIDSLERDECRDIRTSREFCGCSCKSYCDPDSCSCAQAGIKCQVDRLSFPCGCTRDGCGNQNGRVEFNPIRVRTHFIHTLMRIDLEKKSEQVRDPHPNSPPSAQTQTQTPNSLPAQRQSHAQASSKITSSSSATNSPKSRPSAQEHISRPSAHEHISRPTAQEQAPRPSAQEQSTIRPTTERVVHKFVTFPKLIKIVTTENITTTKKY